MINVPALDRFLRQQSLYIAAAVAVGAVFWANGQEINLPTILAYSLSIGNLLNPLIRRLHFLCERPFPYDWLVFVPLLLILMLPVYALSSVLVWWLAPPSPQSLSHLILNGWKFPCLVTLVFGVVEFLYRGTKMRLERRNVELQRKVELSAERLELQEEELERAREIQESLLPKEIPQLPGFEVAAVWHPARAVGGDYFDVLRLDDHRLAFCIADVVGKGVSAALLMANVQAAVRAFASDAKSPAWLCSRVNSVLCGNIASDKFVTFFYGVLDTAARRLEYCNAGHLSPLLGFLRFRAAASAWGRGAGSLPHLGISGRGGGTRIRRQADVVHGWNHGSSGGRRGGIWRRPGGELRASAPDVVRRRVESPPAGGGHPLL